MEMTSQRYPPVYGNRGDLEAANGQMMYAPQQMVMGNVGPYYTPQYEQSLRNSWSDGMCSFCSDCMITLAYLVSFGLINVYQSMEWLSPAERRDAAVCGCESPTGAAVLYGCCCCCRFTQTYRISYTVARKYGISTTCLFCQNCFCGNLMLCRVARHLGRARGHLKH
jgi:hypothetical protein